MSSWGMLERSSTLSFARKATRLFCHTHTPQCTLIKFLFAAQNLNRAVNETTQGLTWLLPSCTRIWIKHMSGWLELCVDGEAEFSGVDPPQAPSTPSSDAELHLCGRASLLVCFCYINKIGVYLYKLKRAYNQQKKNDSPLGCSWGRTGLCLHENKQKRGTATPPSLSVSQGAHTDESASVVQNQDMGEKTDTAVT